MQTTETLSERQSLIVGNRDQLNNSSIIRSTIGSSLIKVIQDNKDLRDSDAAQIIEEEIKQKPMLYQKEQVRSKRPSVVDSDSDGDDAGRDRDDETQSGRKLQIINSTHSGKMIASEEDENVRVTSQTYRKLFAPGGGCCTFFIIQIAMCCFVFCNISATYFTQKWAYADPQE